MINWYNITCNATKHIIPAQSWLFDKYCGFFPYYIDVEDNPIDNWGKRLASMIPDEELVIFGLDDYLPIDYINKDKLAEAIEIIKNTSIERFELGWGASKKKGMINTGFFNNDLINSVGFLEYGKETPYSVSCQFSIWRTSALKRELERTTTPWKFEIYGRAKAACFKDYAFRWIEESALSGRQKGKTNLCGLRLEDEEELISLGYIDKSKVIYGWAGNNERTQTVYGTKYKEYYEI